MDFQSSETAVTNFLLSIHFPLLTTHFTNFVVLEDDAANPISDNDGEAQSSENAITPAILSCRGIDEKKIVEILAAHDKIEERRKSQSLIKAETTEVGRVIPTFLVFLYS